MITPPPRKTSRSAFTLTEVLVVVAIIVVLAGIAVPITLNVLSDAKKDVAVTKGKTLVTAVRTWTARNRDVPVNLEQLLAPPAGTGSLTLDALMDPWDNPYVLVPISGDDPDTFVFMIRSNGTGGRPIEIYSDGTVVVTP